jgi:hypothetical protein
LLAEDVRRKVEAVTPAISYQIGVSASYIRTHYLVGDLILAGDLVEAIVLIRKQLESPARLPTSAQMESTSPPSRQAAETASRKLSCEARNVQSAAGTDSRAKVDVPSARAAVAALAPACRRRRTVVRPVEDRWIQRRGGGGGHLRRRGGRAPGPAGYPTRGL